MVAIRLKIYATHHLHGGSGAVIYFEYRRMAQIRLEPPATFNFRTPDEWLRWRNHFKQLRFTLGLSDDDPKKQINTTLYCIGEEAESVSDVMFIDDSLRTSHPMSVETMIPYFRTQLI